MFHDLKRASVRQYTLPLIPTCAVVTEGLGGLGGVGACASTGAGAPRATQEEEHDWCGEVGVPDYQ